MITKRISQNEIASLKISSLPSRPTAPVSFGGRGFTATEMKAAFDALPLLIAERLNALIDELGGEGFEALVKAIPSGIEDGHTLDLLLADIRGGNFSEYLSVEGQTLPDVLAAIRARIETLEGFSHYTDEDFHLDGGTPADRIESGVRI